MTKTPKLAVIGAGLSGLSLARAIGTRVDVTFFEKSRGVSGRMATRKRDGFAFDHGAQYFTVREDRFKQELAPPIDKGIVQPWTGTFGTMTAEAGTTPHSGSHPRYVGVPSMTALAKFWAEDRKIVFERKVTGLERHDEGWYLACEDAAGEGPFDWVVSTAPAPQTRVLLPFAQAELAALDAVEIDGCFTLMLVPVAPLDPAFAGLQVEHPVIGWIGLNNTKTGRDDAPCLVVHADNTWSSSHIDDPLPEVKEAMLDALRDLLPHVFSADLRFSDLHRWRYANVVKPLGNPFLLDEQQQIAACGDWCLGNRVEAAFMSGALLGDALIDRWTVG